MLVLVSCQFWNQFTFSNPMICPLPNVFEHKAPGLNFINDLRTAFTPADPKSVKQYWWLNCIFYAFRIYEAENIQCWWNWHLLTVVRETNLENDPILLLSFSYSYIMCVKVKNQIVSQEKNYYKLVKARTLDILCNNCCLFCLSYLTPDHLALVL